MDENINNNNNQQPQYQQQPVIPMKQLKTDRGMVKIILLSLITFGIYGLICYGNMSNDLNVVASRYDGKKTMNYYLLVFIITPITLGIGAIVWMHKFCARLGDEARRRGIATDFGAKDYWLWNVIGALIIVGPFIFLHKLLKTMNEVNADYNARG